MQHFILDGSKMITLEAAYAEIAQGLRLPEYFGKNLDALEECLSDLIAQEGKIEIVIENTARLQEALPQWDGIERVFRDNSHIVLTLKA